MSSSRLTRRRVADGHPQPFTWRPLPPHVLRHDVGRIGDLQQRHQAGVGGPGLGFQAHDVGRVAGAVAPEAARGDLGFGEGEPVRGREAFGARRGLGADVVVFDHEMQAAARGGPVSGAVEVEHGDAVQAGVGDQPLVTGDVAVVDHDHQLLETLRQLRVAVEAAPLGEIGRQRVLQQLQRRVQHPHGAAAVTRGRMLGLRQPLDPAPVFVVRIRGDDRDHEVVGPVERAQLQDHRPDQLLGELAVTLEGDRRERPQRHRGRQGVHHRMGLDETPQRDGRHRLEVFRGPGLGCQQPRGQAVRAHTDAHMAEILVGGPALPHPAGARHVAQRPRVGMAPTRGPCAATRRCRRRRPEGWPGS